MPRGTESNAIIQAFLELWDEFNKHHLKADADGCTQTKSNHLQTDVDGYLKAMTMNEIAKEQHSYANQSYLLDQTIDKAVDLLADKAEPFKMETEDN